MESQTPGGHIVIESNDTDGTFDSITVPSSVHLSAVAPGPGVYGPGDGAVNVTGLLPRLTVAVWSVLFILLLL